MKYIDTVNNDVKKYFALLEPDFPEWLNEYIDTKEMLQQQYISMTCGNIYTKLFSLDGALSSLEHSIGVALIVWHFTHDKKQTLSGLFHDIATPAFKHCVDFLNGDYMTQESTEDLTTSIISNSCEIMALLKRDNIEVSEVDNYHLYPIADNDTPKLSADRLEYSLSNAYLAYKISDFDTIKKIYDDIYTQKNEEKEVEIGFKTQDIAIEFVRITSILSVAYRDDRTRYSMQFIADILKELSDDKMITKADLYRLKESEIINIILFSKYGNIFNEWINATSVKNAASEPNAYYVNHGAKVRYIDPLLNGYRISGISSEAKKLIDDNLSYKMEGYVYVDSIKKFTR